MTGFYDGATGQTHEMTDKGLERVDNKKPETKKETEKPEQKPETKPAKMTDTQKEIQKQAKNPSHDSLANYTVFMGNNVTTFENICKDFANNQKTPQVTQERLTNLKNMVEAEKRVTLDKNDLSDASDLEIIRFQVDNITDKLNADIQSVNELLSDPSNPELLNAVQKINGNGLKMSVKTLKGIADNKGVWN